MLHPEDKLDDFDVVPEKRHVASYDQRFSSDVRQDYHIIWSVAVFGQPPFFLLPFVMRVGSRCSLNALNASICCMRGQNKFEKRDRQPIHIIQLYEKVTLRMSILRDLSARLGPSGNEKNPLLRSISLGFQEPFKILLGGAPLIVQNSPKVQFKRSLVSGKLTLLRITDSPPPTALLRGFEGSQYDESICGLKIFSL